MEKDSGLTKTDAEEKLKTTTSKDQEEMLFLQFKMNYKDEEAMFRKVKTGHRDNFISENKIKIGPGEDKINLII